MCGRFFIDADTEFLFNYFNIHMKYKPNINAEKTTIYPTDPATVLISHAGERRAGMMKWGFVLPGKTTPLINSRAERLLEKSFYRESYEKRRCIIPATGFYEWSADKIQHTITSNVTPLLGLAGIYTKVVSASGQIEWRFSIITKEADEPLQSIHSRMPLIIEENVIDYWLDIKTPLMALQSVLEKQNKDLLVRVTNTTMR